LTEEQTFEFHLPPQQINVRGLEVAYRRKGEGEAILYLHGIGMTKRWLPLYEQLAGLGDAVVPEHPGFGDTPLPDWLESFDDLVLHYAELVDLLELGRLHLVGYSFGGWIAAEFAVFFPERLRSLTLIAPFGLRVPDHVRTDIFRMGYERFHELCFNGDAAAYEAFLAYGEPPADLLQAYAEITAAAKVAWNPRYDKALDRRLGRVQAPALVIGAERDQILPAEHIARYAELLPQSRMATIAGAGHAVVAQQPEAIRNEIASLVGGK